MSKLITLRITLPETAWAEVYEAVQSKILAIDNGAYDPEDQPGDNAKWTADLELAREELESVFGMNNVLY